MQDKLFLIVFLAVVAVFFYLLLRVLRAKPVVPVIDSSRRNSFIAIAVLIAALAVGYAIILIQSWAMGSSLSEKGKNVWHLSDIIKQLAGSPLYLFPLILVVNRREPLKSVGLTTKNLWQSILIGVLFFCLLVVPGHNRFDKLLHVGKSEMIALAVYLAIGFGEELAFRGFLQYRVVAWLGAFKGILLTSLIMAMFHMPQMFLNGWEVSRIVGHTLGYMPICLFLGFMMLRTGNLASVALIHAAADWINVLR